LFTAHLLVWPSYGDNSHPLLGEEHQRDDLLL
jgi:hypothetical protein